MCRLRNIAFESVTDGRTDRQTDRQTDGRTDGRTDRQMDDGQSDPYVALCFAATQKNKQERKDNTTTKRSSDFVSRP